VELIESSLDGKEKSNAEISPKNREKSEKTFLLPVFLESA